MMLTKFLLLLLSSASQTGLISKISAQNVSPAKRKLGLRKLGHTGGILHWKMYELREASGVCVCACVCVCVCDYIFAAII